MGRQPKLLDIVARSYPALLQMKKIEKGKTVKVNWKEGMEMQDNKKTLCRNAEGYADHTAGRACVNAHREQIMREKEMAVLHRETMKNLVSYVRRFMQLFGYELVWITYRDPETGQEWKKK